jgi:hypothetical protein
MRTHVLHRAVGVAMVLAAPGCNDDTKAQQAAAQASASAAVAAAASAAAAQKTIEAAPRGCKATGTTPTQLGTIVGDVHGFTSDGKMLYYTCWQVYGSRGDVGKIRKDGKGGQGLAGLDLEPRGLVVDDKNVYYTSGIRLVSQPKEGGMKAVLHTQFSSQSIAIDDTDVYGVPGDYGPYDRVNKVSKKGGDATELSRSTRPPASDGPNGFNRIRVDTTGAYVADSGGRRILRFPLAGGKPTTLATVSKKPFDIAIGVTSVYASLIDGDLVMVSKGGGKATKLASGLVDKARIAADDAAAYATFAGKSGDPSLKLSKIAKDGAATTLATVPEAHSVDAMEVDDDCVYWVERFDAVKSVVYAMPR